ncbi:MAG TPA: GMC family oxidoreductase [Steroidobacteraceae bacterium]|nr:GMC family oxidoreductase [Steroidobacteraceae bacterium]
MNAGHFDAIIVGSGAGGSAAAYRLSEAGLRVLILEKGPRLPVDGSTLDIHHVVRGRRFLSMEPWIGPRGEPLQPEEHFNLGGKTKWYGAALLRFSPVEFEAEPDYAALGWPFSYAELEPFYDEAERLLGVRRFACEPSLKRILDGLGSAESAWQSSSLPMALMDGILMNAHEAAHFDGFASVGNFKGDADVGLLAKISHRPTVQIRTDTEVTELLPADRDSGRIGGVRLRNGDELHATSILLAAGALHSPRLLARYLTRAGLDKRLPSAHLVGRYLKLHHLTALVAMSRQRQRDLLRKTMLTVHTGYPHSSVQALGFDAELIGTLIPRFVPRAIACRMADRAYGFFLQTEDGSHADNRVAEQAGPGGSTEPQRVLNYEPSRTPLSRLEHRRFTRAFRRSLLRLGFSTFIQRIGLNGTAHACGTLVMGSDARHAVVNTRGAVHGIDGLYVVDGSVLPRSSRVNPALTIYAWSLRVAALLTKSLQGHSRPANSALGQHEAPL